MVHMAADMVTGGQSNFTNSGKPGFGLFAPTYFCPNIFVPTNAVPFGDPNNGMAVGQVAPSKVSVDGHLGDDICLHGDVILPRHLDYCLDATTEAASAVQKSGL